MRRLIESMSRRSTKEKRRDVPASRPAQVDQIHAPGQRNWEAAGICAGLVLLVIGVFGQGVGFKFVNYDDNIYVYENAMVLRGLSWAGLRWALFYGGIGHWHPLTWVSHMVDCNLYGTWAGGHHLTNIVLHAAAAVLVFLVLLRMTGALWRCGFVVAAWAVHPLRAESVAWVSERKDVLSAVFFGLTLGAYLYHVRKPSMTRYGLVAMSFACGLMAKNMLVTLPCVLLLLDYWPLGRLRERARFVPLMVEKIPLLMLSAISCVITFLVPEKVIAADRLPLWLRLENSIISCGIYLRQSVWPTGLAAEYPNPTHGFPVWEVAGSLALICLITTAAIGLRSRVPYVFVGWFWFIGMLVPVIGLTQISHYAHADRYTYLPQIGLGIAGTWLAADWAGERRQRRVALGWTGVAIVLALMAGAYRQTGYWRDSMALWTRALACTRDNYLAHNGLGNDIASKGQTEQAITQFRAALQINPASAGSHYDLGNALLKQGQVDQAVDEFRATLRIDPASPDAYCNLGNAYVRLGRIDQAIAQFRAAAQIDPASADTHYDLGSALLGEGRVEEAIAEFNEALKNDPDYADARYDLGNAFLQQRQNDQAIAEYRATLQIDPAYAKAHDNLGYALLGEGRLDEAVAEFNEALRIDPASTDAHCNLGNAFLRQGQIDQAAAQYRAALQIDPNDAEAHCNLGAALFRQRRPQAAAAEYREALRIDPANAAAHSDLGVALLQEGDAAGALAEAEKAHATEPSNLIYQNTLAWILATAPQPSLRDGARALALATQASHASGGGNPVILRTLAAAYAQTGQFPNAAQAAQQALQLAEAESNTALINTLPREIALYRSGHAYEDAH